jgi:hypothetical protein
MAQARKRTVTHPHPHAHTHTGTNIWSFCPSTATIIRESVSVSRYTYIAYLVNFFVNLKHYSKLFFNVCCSVCIFIYDCNYLHQQMHYYFFIKHTQSANRHIPLTTDSVIQDNILNNTITNAIIHTHIKIHVLTILSIYIYIYIYIYIF